MCDTLVRVERGRVLFAKSSDRDPNEAQRLDWQPRQRYLPGARVKATWIELPQVEETHAVLLSRPFWMWGAEIGANEHGLAIGNEAVFTTQPYAATGLTGMDLVRLTLERARDAATGLEVLLGLLAAHGQGGRCGHEDPRFTYHSSFLLADPTRAFVVETAGREAAVDEVRGARSISNGLTIPGFAARHGRWLEPWVAQASARRARTQRCAATAAGVADLRRGLRDHGGAWPRYRPLNGAMAAPCAHAGGLVASTQTTASWVAELTPDGARHWVTATAAPCTSLFKPVQVDQPLDLGPAPTDRADRASLWWRHERLHRLVMRDPARLLPPIARERDEVERRWCATPPAPRDAFAEADRLLARWIEATESQLPVRDRRPPWVRRYWRIRDARSRGDE